MKVSTSLCVVTTLCVPLSYLAGAPYNWFIIAFQIALIPAITYFATKGE